jgi:2-(1,2-epoxy-1,2-dihydrophenyl)acetyl-CoA isomerase
VTATTDYRQILFETRGRVGLITLNRPEKLNAWTYEMGGEMMDAISRCNDDPAIGAVVVTGAGRGFCAGADIGGFNRAIEAQDASVNQPPVSRATARGERDDPAGNSPAAQRRRASLAHFLRDSKPVIAAVNGPSIGVGLTMTLPMDLRIASEQARFSMRFVRMGITPEVASTTYLPQITGIANALELCLTGRIIDAPTALAMGLVSRVVLADELMPTALALAEEIAFNPSESVRAAKEMLHKHMVNDDLDNVVKVEGKTIYAMYSTAGHKEAIRSFIEKREPRFNQ